MTNPRLGTSSARNEWTERFSIRSYEVDPAGALHLVTLAKMLQEAAWQHADALGKAFAERSEGALFWVLSRLRLSLVRFPAWRDAIEITTWPVGIDRVLATREFRVSTAEGEVIGRAFSGWLILDGGSSRPIRPKSVADDIRTEPSEMNVGLAKLPALEDGESVELNARYHDIDHYQHVNNTAYLEWMIDAIGPGPLQGNRVAEADIDFLKETVLNQRVTVVTRQIGQTIWSEVRHSESGECACRARLVLEP